MCTISSALESVDMTSENLRAVIRKAIGKQYKNVKNVHTGNSSILIASSPTVSFS